MRITVVGRATVPSGLEHHLSEWMELCDYFDSEDYQARLEKNKRIKTNIPSDHSMGSKRFATNHKEQAQLVNVQTVPGKQTSSRLSPTSSFESPYPAPNLKSLYDKMDQMQRELDEFRAKRPLAAAPPITFVPWNMYGPLPPHPGVSGVPMNDQPNAPSGLGENVSTQPTNSAHTWQPWGSYG